jgi:hypothetical protein
MILWAANLNWIDPEILAQPFLFWLMIHMPSNCSRLQAICTGMILGTVSLLLILLTNERKTKSMDLNENNIYK